MIDEIKLELKRRRLANLKLGMEVKDNIFDTGLLRVYGELWALNCIPDAQRATAVNQEGWDLITPDNLTIQVKARALYAHNNDSINIDFKEITFDLLFLVLVDDQMNHLADLLFTQDQLLRQVTIRKAGGFRLSNIRSRYNRFEALSIQTEKKGA